MGHLAFGSMQRLNIEAARRQGSQDLLQTPNTAGMPPSVGNGTPISLSTPDILNSIIAIANPFFETATLPDETETLTQQDYDESQDKKIFANLETPLAVTTASGNQGQLQLQNYTDSPNMTTTIAPTISSSSNNNNYNCMAGSPHSMTSTSTSTLSESGVSSPTPSSSQQRHFNFQQQQPSSSVESMRSKLIKDSLKLTIQTKRKNSGKEELDVKSELVSKRPKREEVELTYDFSLSNDSFADESFPPTKLTPEDEERRRRRRERNKVAATKCRNKKKEKTVLLVQEAEILETDNVTLKSDIARMEEEFKRLSSLMESHLPTCPLNNQQDHKPSTSSSQQQHHLQQHQQQDHGGQNMSHFGNSTAAVHQQQHDYNNQQDLNPHLAISTHHNNHNHFMGTNNMNMNYFGGPLHHQSIQLS